MARINLEKLPSFFPFPIDHRGSGDKSKGIGEEGRRIDWRRESHLQLTSVLIPVTRFPVIFPCPLRGEGDKVRHGPRFNSITRRAISRHESRELNFNDPKPRERKPSITTTNKETRVMIISFPFLHNHRPSSSAHSVFPSPSPLSSSSLAERERASILSRHVRNLGRLRPSACLG